MTAHNCTASAADLENTSYLYPVITLSKALHVAEDTGDYGKENKKLKKQSMQVIAKHYSDISKNDLNLSSRYCRRGYIKLSTICIYF
ncbi:MAG: hypothetical protein ACPHLK_09525 [Gammaproteobacteria bacterium]